MWKFFLGICVIIEDLTKSSLRNSQMIFAPNIIKTCPICNRKLTFSETLSENNFGAQYRTDGRVGGRMMLGQQRFLRCPNGKHTFWSKDTKYYSTSKEYWVNQKYNRKNASLVRGPEKPLVKDFVLAIENKEFQNLDEEIFLRLEYWRTENDERLRFKKEKPLTKKQIDNINVLLNILDRTNIIWIAELHRELKEYQNCIESLRENFHFYKKCQILLIELLVLAKKKDSYPRYLN